jgi:hypothetical protein
MEGHGVFRVEGDAVYSTLHPWEAFNDDITTNFGRWRQADDQFTAGSASSSGGSVDSRVYAAGLPNASWLVLHLPYGVNLKGYSICPQTGQSPGNIQIWGSNDGGTSWSHLHSQTQTNGDNTAYQNYTISHKGHYSIIAYLILTLAPSTQTYPTATEASIRNMQYYGTPAPSAIEDGHLTLGKALTLPRVSGHAAGAETPRAESLVLHYDTTVDSVVSGSTVVDTSGNGLNGALENGSTYSSSLRAFQFDGTNDWLSAPINNSGGAWVHSMSFWFKFNGGSAGGLYSLVHIGAGASTQNIMSDVLVYTDGKIRFGFYANDSDTATGLIDPNIWYHVVCTYNGGAGNASSRLVYINGQSKTLTTVGAYTSSTLNLAANTDVYLGSQQGNSSFPGSISNFKLYNVVLTAEEVAMEYALGRTGKSLNLTDTALCLGGTVPRAQLDVRGSALIGGNVGIGTTNPQDKLHIYGTDSQLFQIQNTNDTARMVLNGASGTGGDLIFKQNGTPTWGIASIGDKLHFLGDDSTSQYRMTLDNSGNVGIGTTSPDEKLHVNGNILTNNFRFNSVRKTVNLAHNTTTTVHTMTSGDCGLLFAISAIGNGQHFGVMIFQWTSGRSSASTHTIFNSGYSTFTSNSTNIWIKHNDSNGATLSTDIRILKF